MPGGSVALRYPAVGDGDTITHVRVSGIDFGTDLKANILDGGPGYNYVVLVFLGNQGVPYDAVMTVQTLPAEIAGNSALNEQTESVTTNDGYKVPDIGDSIDEESLNNSKEEMDDAQPLTSPLLQSQASSDSYKYEERHRYESNDFDDEDRDEHDEKDSHNHDDEKKNQESHQEQALPSDNEITNNDGNPKAERYSVNDGYVVYDDDGEQSPIGPPLGYVDNNLYGKYKALKPHLYDDVKISPQRDEGDQQIQENSRDEFSQDEDPIELNQMFNDEEVHNDALKYKDSNNNNNYFDGDDSSAVAY